MTASENVAKLAKVLDDCIFLQYKYPGNHKYKMISQKVKQLIDFSDTLSSDQKTFETPSTKKPMSPKKPKKPQTPEPRSSRRTSHRLAMSAIEVPDNPFSTSRLEDSIRKDYVQKAIKLKEKYVRTKYEGKFAKHLIDNNPYCKIQVTPTVNDTDYLYSSYNFDFDKNKLAKFIDAKNSTEEIPEQEEKQDSDAQESDGEDQETYPEATSITTAITTSDPVLQEFQHLLEFLKNNKAELNKFKHINSLRKSFHDTEKSIEIRRSRMRPSTASSGQRSMIRPPRIFDAWKRPNAEIRPLSGVSRPTSGSRPPTAGSRRSQSLVAEQQKRPKSSCASSRKNEKAVQAAPRKSLGEPEILKKLRQIDKEENELKEKKQRMKKMLSESIRTKKNVGTGVIQQAPLVQRTVQRAVTPSSYFNKQVKPPGSQRRMKRKPIDTKDEVTKLIGKIYK